MMKKKLSLPVQILIALVLGIAVGLLCFFTGNADFTTNYLKPFGTIFVNLLKFVVVPVVLFSMIDGILSMNDMKKVGSVGWKTVAYFLCTTAIACVVGLAFATLFNNAGLFPTLVLEAHLRELYGHADRHLPLQYLGRLRPCRHAAGHRDRSALRRRYHGCRRKG